MKDDGFNDCKSDFEKALSLKIAESSNLMSCIFSAFSSFPFRCFDFLISEMGFQRIRTDIFYFVTSSISCSPDSSYMSVRNITFA